MPAPAAHTSLEASSVTSAAAPTAAAPKPFTDAQLLQAVQDETQRLKAEDPSTAASAAAALFLLASRRQAAANLASAVPLLTTLLSSPDSLCQRNAVAALSAIMNQSEQLLSTVASSPDLVPALLSLLPSDPSTAINAAAAISQLAQSASGISLLSEAAADEELLSALTRFKNDGAATEAILDAICSLAAAPSCRPHLVEKGAVELLASFLKPAGSEQQEVTVRSLLALGMLLSSESNGAERLVLVEGSITNLLALIRSTDGDVKAIAGDLFSAVARVPSLQGIVEEQIRQSPAT